MKKLISKFVAVLTAAATAITLVGCAHNMSNEIIVFTPTEESKTVEVTEIATEAATASEEVTTEATSEAMAKVTTELAKATNATTTEAVVATETTVTHCSTKKEVAETTITTTAGPQLTPVGNTVEGDNSFNDDVDASTNWTYYCIYTVQPGDTYSKLYYDFWVTQEQICAFNGIDPNAWLQAGWTLYIPNDDYVAPYSWEYTYSPSYGPSNNSWEEESVAANSNNSAAKPISWKVETVMYNPGYWVYDSPDMENVRRALGSVSGYTIRRKTWFWWSDVIGTCLDYKEGGTVEGKAPGGGICAAAAAIVQLFSRTLMDILGVSREEVEQYFSKNPHNNYYPEYVETYMDQAMLDFYVDDWGNIMDISSDLGMYNPTDYDITVYFWMDAFCNIHMTAEVTS